MKEAGSGWSEIKKRTLEFVERQRDTINNVVPQPLLLVSTSQFNSPRGITMQHGLKVVGC